MDPLEDFTIICLLASLVAPAILIIILGLYRLTGCLGYYKLKWEFVRLPYKTLCTICLESAKDGGLAAAYRLPCGHWFHKNCLYVWLYRHNNCPNCRRIIGYWNGRQIEPVLGYQPYIYLDEARLDNRRPRALWPYRPPIYTRRFVYT
ncbi:E3 ubiquitin-protein ligase RNF133 [Drosophila virilis]|uniref:RING-type domain-containing protein n=1 Tax=Drosophila virilis TaxID=7244 RepID=B4M7I1_DROVI|nr:autophagy-related protein 36 [Drosophila virilis]EDW62748.1 uncharacterized protein Dvir_GJ16446 [Drosophila virilis]